MDLRESLEAARVAARRLATLSGPERSALLLDFAAALSEPAARNAVLAANAKDMAAAREEEKAGRLGSALLKRLALDAKKLATTVDGITQLARMPELIGRTLTHRVLDHGLILKRVTAPLGVLGVVFEARPDALVQITSLAWKSGNAVALKGGREAAESNRALGAVAHGVLGKHGIDPAAMLLLEARSEVDSLLGMDDLVEMVIARGSSEFIRHVRGHTRIPVMAHADGICHLYLHASADPAIAARVAVDAKCSYPAACNAVETLLWDPGAGAALDATVAALEAQKVELRGCEATRQRHPRIKPATGADWDTEYGALILSIRQVPDVGAALAHIARHGSRHTDAIVAQDAEAARRFLAEVDSACVFHNASTRFSDGYRFGLGAEVGISTDKLHARGPVGVEGLLTYRWLLHGRGQCTTDYSPEGRHYIHKDLPVVLLERVGVWRAAGRAGPRLAGRGARERERERVRGRDAEGAGRGTRARERVLRGGAGRSRSRQPPTRAGIRWSLPLTGTLAGRRWPRRPLAHVRQSAAWGLKPAIHGARAGGGATSRPSGAGAATVM